jgi:hypothetical protein
VNGLSPRQLETLEALERYTDAKGYPPTLRELGVALGGVSTRCVQGFMEALQRKGFVEIGAMSARSRRSLRTPQARVSLILDDGTLFDGRPFARAGQCAPGIDDRRLDALLRRVGAGAGCVWLADVERALAPTTRR